LAAISAVGSAEEAVETVVQIHPDVIVVDIMLPGMNGIDAVRPETRILALSNHLSSALVHAVLAAGGGWDLCKKTGFRRAGDGHSLGRFRVALFR
jgi:DNA-binding NarL/FixJ family response regulator